MYSTQMPGFDNEMPSERLITSVSNGDVEGVKAALAAGADPDFNRSGTPVLTLAIGAGNIEIVQALIDKGADINQPNRRGWLPIHEAASKGRTEVVGILAKAPMAFLEMDYNGEFPLHQAAAAGHAETVQALLDTGAGVDPRDQGDRLTPLMRAVDGHHRDAVRVLLAAGANPDQTDQNGRSARDRLDEWEAGADLFVAAQGIRTQAPMALPTEDGEDASAPAEEKAPNPVAARLGLGQVRKRGPR